MLNHLLPPERPFFFFPVLCRFDTDAFFLVTDVSRSVPTAELAAEVLGRIFFARSLFRNMLKISSPAFFRAPAKTAPAANFAYGSATYNQLHSAPAPRKPPSGSAFLLFTIQRESAAASVAHEAERASRQITDSPSYYLASVAEALARSGDNVLARKTAERATEGEYRLLSFASVLRTMASRQDPKVQALLDADHSKSGDDE